VPKEAELVRLIYVALKRWEDSNSTMAPPERRTERSRVLGLRWGQRETAENRMAPCGQEPSASPMKRAVVQKLLRRVEKAAD
jgi:hypothetical protein